MQATSRYKWIPWFYRGFVTSSNTFVALRILSDPKHQKISTDVDSAILYRIYDFAVERKSFAIRSAVQKRLIDLQYVIAGATVEAFLVLYLRTKHTLQNITEYIYTRCLIVHKFYQF